METLPMFCIDLRHITLNRFCFSKPARTLKVIRATLNNGSRILGMRYPAILVPLVEKAIDDRQTTMQLKAAMRLSGLPDDPNLLSSAQVEMVMKN